MVIKIEFTGLSQTATFVPFIKGFKNVNIMELGLWLMADKTVVATLVPCKFGIHVLL